ncbi:MAG TPA: hypothetical protein VIE64_07140 [Solirubrobacterales bacterium]
MATIWRVVGRMLGKVVIALASTAALVFVGVGLTELNYVSGHPYAYGPAKVIAWASGGGILLSIAVGLLAYVTLWGKPADGG